MPTARIDVTAVSSTYNAWTLGAGADKVVAVQTNDSDTTYITSSTAAQRQAYTLQAKPAMAALNQVDTSSRARKTGGVDEQYQNFIRLGGTDSDGSANSPTGSYALLTTSAWSRPGGGSWAPVDLDTLEIGNRRGVANGGEIRVTEKYCTVDYTAPAGGFNWLLTCWLPPLVAVASHAITRREIAAALSCLKIRPSSDEEFARLLEAFLVRPAYA